MAIAVVQKAALRAPCRREPGGQETVKTVAASPCGYRAASVQLPCISIAFILASVLYIVSTIAWVIQ
jgi:hypothetical protein